MASSLEVNPSNQTDDADADNLLDIMDQLLERTVNDGTTQGHNHAMDIDEDGNLGYDHERDATVRGKNLKINHFNVDHTFSGGTDEHRFG